MNCIDILGNLSNMLDPTYLTNCQPKLTVVATSLSPSSLLNNIPTIDLTNH